MNYNDIVARIKKGENPEDIVKEFTDNINKAQKEIAAEAEAAKASEVKSKKLDEISATIAGALNEYTKVAGVDAKAMTTADVRELLDKFLPIVESLKNLHVHVAKGTPKATKKFNNPEDTFAWFFREMNI